MLAEADLPHAHLSLGRLLYVCDPDVYARRGRTSSPPPPARESAEHKQLDFWVGEWDVYRSDNNELVARGVIEKLYGGCAVRENWMPLNGFGAGGSLNSYRPEEKRWRQVYTGAGNGWAEYTGSIQAGAMVLRGVQMMPDGSRTSVRMTYKRGPENTVLQASSRRMAEGPGRVGYQFTYRPSDHRNL